MFVFCLFWNGLWSLSSLECNLDLKLCDSVYRGFLQSIQDIVGVISYIVPLPLPFSLFQVPPSHIISPELNYLCSWYIIIK